MKYSCNISLSQALQLAFINVEEGWENCSFQDSFLKDTKKIKKSSVEPRMIIIRLVIRSLTSSSATRPYFGVFFIVPGMSPQRTRVSN